MRPVSSTRTVFEDTPPGRDAGKLISFSFFASQLTQLSAQAEFTASRKTLGRDSIGCSSFLAVAACIRAQPPEAGLRLPAEREFMRERCAVRFRIAQREAGVL